jgi:HEAT repeat protein
MMAAFLLLTLSATPRPDPEAIDKAWSVLKEGVSDKSSDRRAKAVHALRLLPKNHRAEEMAEKALSDENFDVRTEGANALGQMGAISARPKLRNALDDKELKVVIAAANALYLLKDPVAYEIYYAMLTGQRKSNQGLVQSQLDTLKNRKAVEKLAFETGIGFVPFGGMGYEAWKTITRSDSLRLRAEAADRLATDPDPKSGKALADSCYDSKWQIRAAAVNAIAKRGDPALLHAITPLLYDSNDSVRFDAAATILKLCYYPKSSPHATANGHTP